MELLYENGAALINEMMLMSRSQTFRLSRFEIYQILQHLYRNGFQLFICRGIHGQIRQPINIVDLNYYITIGEMLGVK